MKKRLFIFTLIQIFISSCSKDSHSHNDQESINKITVDLVSASHTAVFSFEDKDGDGGLSPILKADSLKTNQSYTATIKAFKFENNAWVETTDEILREGVDHQFFFAATANALETNYADLDVNGKPIGLKSTWITKSVAAGKLKLTLLHEPNKSAQGAATGDKTNAGGETDVEIEWDVKIN
jgi:hypothetical protein